jgi:hypothetical protein
MFTNILWSWQSTKKYRRCSSFFFVGIVSTEHKFTVLFKFYFVDLIIFFKFIVREVLNESFALWIKISSFFFLFIIILIKTHKSFASWSLKSVHLSSLMKFEAINNHYFRVDSASTRKANFWSNFFDLITFLTKFELICPISKKELYVNVDHCSFIRVLGLSFSDQYSFKVIFYIQYLYKYMGIEYGSLVIFLHV